MRVDVGTYRFAEPGGSETYALTVAQELERLGHDAAIVAAEHGPFGDFARGAGVQVVAVEDRSRPAPDALISQDGVVAHLLAEQHSGVPHVFVAHSLQHDLQYPPELDVCDAVVVLNDRVGRRVRAMAQSARIVRLRQPVDIRRFSPGPALPERPRRVLLLGNRLRGEKRAAVLRACEKVGLDCHQRGRTASSTVRPETDLRGTHVVMGHGRAIVEAMACGRAAYVFDIAGEDGWVTTGTYAELERDGFAGGAFEMPFDPERLARSLSEYRADMGPANRDRVRREHNASTHAVELVELIESVGTPAARPDLPHDELARLSRLQWHAESRSSVLRDEGQAVAQRLESAETRAERAERRLRAIQASRPYRLLRALGRLVPRS